MKNMILNAVACTLIAGSISSVRAQAPTDTTFTYQGRLVSSGVPHTGTADVRFSLYDAANGGTLIGSAITKSNMSVTDGLFDAELDFGGAGLDGSGRWLEIEVRSPAGGGSFTTLTPRQPLTAAPFSMQTRGIFVDETKSFVGVGRTEGITTQEVFGIYRDTNEYGGMYAETNGPNGKPFYGYSADGGSDAFHWYDGTTGDWKLYTDGSTRLTVANDGTLTSTGVVVSRGGSAGAFLAANPINLAASFSLGWLDDVARLRIGGNGPGASGGLDIQRTGDASLMRILHNGNVGIGTTAPATRLHLVGADTIMQTASSSSTAGTWLEIENTSAGGKRWGVLSTGSANGEGAGKMLLRSISDGVTVMVLDGNGNVGVGVNNPAARLHGVSFGGNSLDGMRGESTLFSGVGVRGRGGPTGFDFYADGAGVNYGTSSSIRWKQNVEPIADPLGTIARLRGVTFDWDAAHGGTHDIGFIAEEVGAVVPQLVAYEENGIDAIGMDYAKLTPLLAAAVNALRTEKDAEIEELRGRIAALENLVVAQSAAGIVTAQDEDGAQ